MKQTVGIIEIQSLAEMSRNQTTFLSVTRSGTISYPVFRRVH